jgi:hypothetical protein
VRRHRRPQPSAAAQALCCRQNNQSPQVSLRICDPGRSHAHTDQQISKNQSTLTVSTPKKSICGISQQQQQPWRRGRWS